MTTHARVLAALETARVAAKEALASTDDWAFEEYYNEVLKALDELLEGME